MRIFRKKRSDEGELYSLDEAYDDERLSLGRRLWGLMREAADRDAKEGSISWSIDQWATGAWRRGSRAPMLLLALVMILLVALVFGLVVLLAGFSRVFVVGAAAGFVPGSVSFETVPVAYLGG